MAFAPAIGAIATLASTAVSAFSAISQAQSAQAAAEYQAAVARNNAKAAEDMRRYSIQKGLTEAEEQDRANAELRGKQRAAMAASGFDMNEGTMEDIQVSQSLLGRTDSLRRAHKGQLEGWNYKQRANNFLADAALSEASGRNSMMAGLFSAGGSLIGGAGQFASKWGTFSSAPVVPTQSYRTPSVYGTIY